MNNIKNIDDETAILLYDNNIKSIDDLNNASIKELVKIDGIKKKEVKKFKKEIEKKFVEKTPLVHLLL